MPSIDTSTVSPGWRYTGGSKPMPTPDGVPVAITSPGRSRTAAEMASMRVGMSKIRSLMGASWRGSPLTVVRRRAA